MLWMFQLRVQSFGNVVNWMRSYLADSHYPRLSCPTLSCTRESDRAPDRPTGFQFEALRPNLLSSCYPTNMFFVLKGAFSSSYSLNRSSIAEPIEVKRTIDLSDLEGHDREVAESEGFEPPIALRLCLISSQVHSTGLCQLSASLKNSRAGSSVCKLGCSDLVLR